MMIQTSTISDKYQTVVPALVRRTLGIKRGQKVTWVVDLQTGSPVASVAPEKIDWAARLAGLGKGTWSNVDPQEYINSLRNEWQD